MSGRKPCTSGAHAGGVAQVEGLLAGDEDLAVEQRFERGGELPAAAGEKPAGGGTQGVCRVRLRFQRSLTPQS